MSNDQAKGLSYRDAGVDIERGEELVRRIKPGAAATSRAGVMGGLGGFGGLFDLAACGYRDPVLVSSSRRFRGRRPAAIVFGWFLIHGLFHLGVSPDRLARMYNSSRRI